MKKRFRIPYFRLYFKAKIAQTTFCTLEPQNEVLITFIFADTTLIYPLLALRILYILYTLYPHCSCCFKNFNLTVWAFQSNTNRIHEIHAGNSNVDLYLRNRASALLSPVFPALTTFEGYVQQYKCAKFLF